LQTEIENRNAGFANNVETAKKEVAEAKKRQAEALAEQKKAQKAQERIQTEQQAGNLITASAKIWGSLGFPAAIPALAIMWGSFTASKIRAAQLTKTIRKDGGWDIIGGGSHASGEDTYLGYESGGSPVYAERGELNATISRPMTSKYRGVLPTIIDSLNNGTFERVFVSAHRNAKNMTVVNNTTSTKKMESLLSDIKDGQQQGNSYVDGQGRTVVTNSNYTKIYV
jgi:hypothetical protein